MPISANQDLNGKWKVSASHTGPAELEIPAEFIYKEVSSVTMTITSEPTSADTRWITPLGEPISLDDIERKYTPVVLGGFKYVVTNDNFGIKPYIPPATYLNAKLGKTSFASGGGSTNLSISSNTAWEITLNPEDDWVTVAPTMVGTGNDSRSVTVAENTGAARNCLITISGAGIDEPTRVTLSQKKGEALFLMVAPDQTLFTSGGGIGTLTISSNTSWEINNLASWINIVGATAGTGNAVCNISVDANTNTVRTADIIITGNGVSDVTITITQAKAESKTLKVALSPSTFDAHGGTATLSITSNTSWEITELPSWVGIVGAPSTGSGNAERHISVDANTSDARTGNIIVTGEGVARSISKEITQSGLTLLYISAWTTETSFPSTGKNATLYISGNVTWSAITTEADSEWIPYISRTTGTSGYSTPLFTVKPNNRPWARDGAIIVSGASMDHGEEVPIHQEWLPFTDSIKTMVTIENIPASQTGAVFSIDVYTTLNDHIVFTLDAGNGFSGMTYIDTHVTGESQTLYIQVKSSQTGGTPYGTIFSPDVKASYNDYQIGQTRGADVHFNTPWVSYGKGVDIRITPNFRP